MLLKASLQRAIRYSVLFIKTAPFIVKQGIITPEERSRIASEAASVRWNIPKATHEGSIEIGNTKIPCAVLEDGTRALTQWGFLRAIGRSGRPAAGRGSDVEKIAPFLALDNLKPYVNKGLADSTKPIVFRTTRGLKAFGYKAESLEIDEAWTFIQKKQRLLSKKEKQQGVLGDQFIWVALDRETKLIPAHLVAKRSTESAYIFLKELRERVVNTPQITTDQFSGYKTAIPMAFGSKVHFATIRKSYSGSKDRREHYSPPKLRRVFISKYIGNPDPKKICTSFVERQNLTMRTQIKRLTRLTNAFSKTVDGLKAALALHFWHYNFARIHQTLRMTPAMKAGIFENVLDWDEVLN